VQLLPVFALFGGIGGVWLWENSTARRGLIIVGVAVGVSFVAALPVYFASTPELASERSTNDPRVISAIGVGNEIARLTGRDDRIQVLWANAAVYWYADRIPATRYLWYRNIERIPGGRQGVVDAFVGPVPPAIAVGYQPVAALDIDGQIQAVLDARYDELVIDGQPVWRLRP
jgi:hypothetical protein